MRVCLMIEGREDVTWEDWRALARACEEHGVETLFRSDHYLSVEGRGERGSLDAWATIAALAAVTSTVRLGTLVSPATFRHPSELAKVVATADQVPGGRVELGMGTGWLEAEHTAYGFPFPPLGERMEVLEEQLQVVTGQWADGPFSFGGRHYAIEELDAHPKPVQRPRPPLIMGGSGGPRSLALAARFADESRGLRPLTAGCAGVSPGYKDRRRVRRDAAQPRRGLPAGRTGTDPAVAHDRLARRRGPRRVARPGGSAGRVARTRRRSPRTSWPACPRAGSPERWTSWRRGSTTWPRRA